MTSPLVRPPTSIGKERPVGEYRVRFPERSTIQRSSTPSNANPTGSLTAGSENRLASGTKAPDHVWPSTSIPAMRAPDSAIAMLASSGSRVPACPSTGRVPPSTSCRTPIVDATYAAASASRPDGSTLGQASLGCGLATPGTNSGWPAAVKLTACTSGSCFKVQTSCCESAWRDASSANCADASRSTWATPASTRTASIFRSTPSGKPVRTAGLSHSLGPSKRRRTKVVASPGPTTGIIRESGTRISNDGSKKYRA